MAFQSSILSQIIKLVNRYEFQKQVSKYKGDYKVSKLSCFNLLVLMIFTHLKINKTLRDIVSGFSGVLSSFYHLGLQSVKRSTISDALRKRSAQIWEDFYYSIISGLNRPARRRLAKKMHLIDSTIISLCLSNFDWATYRKAKGGIKLHVMLAEESKIAEKIIMTKAMVHDIKAIKDKIKFQKGDFYVYDRAYACYNYLYSIELAKAYFVTRLKSNWKFQVLKNKKIRGGSGILADQLIEVTGTKHDAYPKTLRLVTFYHLESRKKLHFLTNNFSLAAQKIAEIYKRRWQIELFFKWIKQHLKVKSFLSTSENGVKIQIWTALITYVLLCLLKMRFVCEIDIFEIYRRVGEHLFNRMDIYDLFGDVFFRKKPLLKYHQLELKFG